MVGILEAYRSQLQAFLILLSSLGSLSLPKPPSLAGSPK